MPFCSEFPSDCCATADKLNTAFMYPTKEQFEKMLLTHRIDSILDDQLFSSGVPFSFSGQPEVHREMVDEISRGLRVPTTSICVVGSARLGFSLAPQNFGRPFGQYSDLDIIVVSHTLFDPSWLDILTNRRTPWSELRKQTRYRLIEHREKHRIYNGWIVPHFIPEALGIGERWLTTFNGLSQIPFLAGREVSGRLYRTWDHAKLYHRWSLERLRDAIAA